MISSSKLRFLLNAQLMFSRKEREPTTRQYDDDEWIRSLAVAEYVIADVPETLEVHSTEGTAPAAAVKDRM